MPLGAILAHKHTLVEAYAGFFRALATESFAAVRQWLHPELEQLIFRQCQQQGETVFLRGLRHGLGSASQRLRLGSSQAQGAGQIRTQLVDEQGEQAGSVRFVLVPDGWRVYAVEVWTASKPPMHKHAPAVAPRHSGSVRKRELPGVDSSRGACSRPSKIESARVSSSKASCGAAATSSSPQNSSESGGMMKVTSWLRKLTLH